MNTAREIRNIWDAIGRMKARTAGSSPGAVTFLGLNDTPATYAGKALKVVRVNAGTNALEFGSRLWVSDAAPVAEGNDGDLWFEY